MSVIESKIEELGLKLPKAPGPMANYVTARRTGNLLFFSGGGPFEDGKPVVFGRVGDELTQEEGYAAARLTGLNLISQLKNELGDLDRVKQFVKVQAFVASAPGFTAQPAVMNGVSDLLVEVFGEAGKHARTAVAVPQLPFNIPIEVEIIVEVE
ncbi:MAG TPA: RidA family protein [Candidatus Scatomorpha intestinavium]|uniref:RidA family protein n=1 Tax=Candidatus Scatomorpha intestinavium TaxID=2840922 RepID=A0A9D0ZDF1_9FIRM|nr:RidA family protein [Candidatus Scatomorpha intestinavium]